MAVDPSVLETPNDSDKARPWEFVLQLAGAVGGLASLVYVIGATTIWFRAKLVGLPADIAIEHESRSSVIAVGLRGILYVVLPYALVAALGAVALRIGISVHNRKPENQRHFNEVVCEGATKLSRHPFRIAAVDAILIGAASLWSWRAFAAVIGAVAAFGGALWWLDTTRKVKVVGTLGLALAAVVTGLGWQITNRIAVQGAWLTPPIPGIDHPVPYFGETGSYIYVGGQRRDPANRSIYFYTHQIEELRRRDYLLTYNGKSFNYCREDLSPAAIFQRLLTNNNTTPKLVQC